MEYKNISAGELSALLEVQRSNISHVLNGRNMPGAAFIEKLLVSFPDLNARWLITGEGEMVSEEGSSVVSKVEKTDEIQVSAGSKSTGTKNTGNIDKQIAKVVLLFSDGTFIDYDQK